MQLRVLRLGLLQDGDVGVGVFPEGEEVLVSGFGFGGVALQGIGSSKLEMGECAEWEVQHKAAMVEELLELSRCSGAVVFEQISLSPKVSGVQSSELERWWLTQFVGSSGFEMFQSLGQSCPH